MDGKTTQYGFDWGPVDVSRACSDEKKGWVLLLVKTKKHPHGIQVYVTKSGKVRVHSDVGEWLPNVDVTGARLRASGGQPCSAAPEPSSGD